MPESQLILLIPLLPLLAAILIGALGPRLLRGQSHWVAILAAAGSCAAAIKLYSRDWNELGDLRVNLYTWFTAGAANVNVAVSYDQLAAVMLLVVTAVSLLVMIYSREYMKGERGYTRFFACMSLFVFSMCTLVLADNFLLLLVGWEGVGLCSYLLIGYYYEKPAAAAAAKKAFLVTRTGDLGLLLGVVLTFLAFGSIDFATVLDAGSILKARAEHPTPFRLIPLLLLCGAMGKSGQLLLHVWLPDAMEGPSPVSALIHAATMVTAGVYLTVRTIGLFDAADALPVVAIVGGATALFAATIALVQVDIKRVLAYSTISQLGYMFLAVGAFAGGKAIMHLFTHAFFKALLFLSAGAVMHAAGGVIDLRRLGGLYRRMPFVAALFLIGCAALSGIVGTSGFASKDPIIEAAFEAEHLGQAGPVLGVLALVTAGADRVLRVSACSCACSPGRSNCPRRRMATCTCRARG